jgi:plasmid stabilization system protein ParE
MLVRFHLEADQELTEATNWYRERSVVAAQAFTLEIDHAIASIAEAPLRWPQGRRGERRFVLIASLTPFCIVSEQTTSSSQRLLIKAGAPATGGAANSAGQLVAGADVAAYAGPRLPPLAWRDAARRAAGNWAATRLSVNPLAAHN